jgi:hypothetical protein
MVWSKLETAAVTFWQPEREGVDTDEGTATSACGGLSSCFSLDGADSVILSGLYGAVGMTLELVPWRREVSLLSSFAQNFCSGAFGLKLELGVVGRCCLPRFKVVG